MVIILIVNKYYAKTFIGFNNALSISVLLFINSIKLAPLKAPPALVPISIPKLLAKPKAPDNPPPPALSSSNAKLKVAV